MHLVKLQDKFYATPAALDEWQPFLPLIEKYRNQHVGLVLVSDADASNIDPERIRQGFVQGSFLPQPEMQVQWGRLSAAFGASNKAASAYRLRQRASAEQKLHYMHEDIIAAQYDDKPGNMPTCMRGVPELNAYLVHVGTHYDHYAAMTGLHRACWNEDALAARERDFRILALGHELTHTRARYGSLTPYSAICEEIFADAGAALFHAEACALDDRLDPQMGQRANALRCLNSFLIHPDVVPAYRHLPNVAPFNEVLHDKTRTPEIWSDYISLHRLMHQSAGVYMTQALDGMFIAARALENTGMLSHRQERMCESFCHAVDSVMASDFVRNAQGVRLKMHARAEMAAAEIAHAIAARNARQPGLN